MRGSIVCTAVMVMILSSVGCSQISPPSSPVSSGSTSSQYVNTVACAPNAVEVTLIFALNPQQNYMTPAIDNFNGAYAEGRNPVSGRPLSANEPRICVLGQLGSSSRIAQAIANTVIAPNNENIARPTMFAPSVSTWLALSNYRSGRELFNLSEVQPIALTPVVMAIWESRLQAIRQTIGRDDIGWAELLDVLNSPNGWRDYGIANGRRAVYYGHTDPRTSSTGLSALIAEFYASAREKGFTGRQLTAEAVSNPEVLGGVRDIEQLIRHYTTRTDDYLNYIAQGPDYVDFVALEEVDVLFLNGSFANQGFASDFTPPERLVALYPAEGTVWHERPVGIVNGDWVTTEQRAAAQVFIDYLLTPEVQRDVLARGFRPVNQDVEIGYPFVEENGVRQQGPQTILDMPSPETIVAIQQNWSLVKKQADVLLLIDVSGSMGEENKLAQAQQAALAFIEEMENANRIGLAVFSSEVSLVHDLEQVESARDKVSASIQNLGPVGETELYAAVRDMVKHLTGLEDSNRIRALVVLSDGEDTGNSGVTLGEAVQAIADSRDDENPVIVVPLAYGANADITALGDIGRASQTAVQPGSPENIQDVLAVIRSFF